MKERIVCVEWDDAAYSSGYYEKKDKERFAPVKTKTAGFVIESDRKCMIISHERFYDEQGKVDEQRHITTIPRAMIRKVIELEGKHK